MAEDRSPRDADNGAHHGHLSPDEDRSLKGAIVRLLHPIPLTVLLILVSVLLLVAANVLNVDNGRVLVRMANHEFARGLITYLFAVVTIGTAVVLVLAAFTGGLEAQAYERGKEILALLLGVFGTIVGFYFGSEAHKAPTNEELAGAITLTQPLLSETSLASGASAHLTAYVIGGTPPYSFAITIGEPEDMKYDNPVKPDGWIVASIAMPDVPAATEQRITLGVKDAAGFSATKEVVVSVRPKAP